MQDKERRTYTDAERAVLLEGYRSWQGTQGAYAASVGVPASTLSRWVNGDVRPHRSGAATTAPAMLEVVPSGRRAVDDARPGAARFALGAGVELTLDELPPARWVAELVEELRRC